MMSMRRTKDPSSRREGLAKRIACYLLTRCLLLADPDRRRHPRLRNRRRRLAVPRPAWPRPQAPSGQPAWRTVTNIEQHKHRKSARGSSREKGKSEANRCYCRHKAMRLCIDKKRQANNERPKKKKGKKLDLENHIENTN